MSRFAIFNQFKTIFRKNPDIQNITKDVNNMTRKLYPSSKLMHFNENDYRTLYRNWGEMGIFNHHESQIDSMTYGMICHSIEKIDSGLRSGYSVQSSLVINPIEKFGTESTKKKYLEKLYTGIDVGCFGLTEPDAGSDPGSMKTRAVLKGSHYVVSGSKTWITNAPIADTFVIWCKDEEDQIIGLVSERKEGIVTPTIEDKTTLMSSPTGMILMDGLEIPIENKLMVRGLGGPFHCLNKARYGISWGVVGAAEDCLEIAANYCDQRKQFNRKLSANQMIQKDLVHCITLYNDMLNRSAMGMNRIESFDDLKQNLEQISMLKRKNCSDALEIARTTRDILGGNGVSHSYGIVRHMLNLEAVNTYEGTRNIHDLIVGKILLGVGAF